MPQEASSKPTSVYHGVGSTDSTGEHVLHRVDHIVVQGSCSWTTLLNIVSFPARIFCACRKNGSGQLPIPFSFKCAGVLVHCSLGFSIFRNEHE